MARDTRSRDELAAARATTRQLYGAAMESKASDAFCLSIHRTHRARAHLAGVALEEVVAAGRGPGGGGVLRAGFAASIVEFSPETPLADEGTPTERLQAARTAGYRALGGVYDEIERRSGIASVGRPRLEDLGATPVQTLETQVCWLNRTLRTWAGPDVVAEICSDSSVSAVDVPRLLRPDDLPSNPDTVGLPAFVAATGLTGKGVIVAVIDSEVALSHPALKGRVVHRRNYTKEPWGNPHSHGTAVAGFIAARDPDSGGIAPDATIYNYKVLASVQALQGDDFGGALAIQQALEDGAAVANCSWGAGPVTSTKSRQAVAVDRAWTLGLIVVKSAGNAGPAKASMTIPAEADGIIVVGASDLGGKLVEDYSSRGPVAGRPGPHCVAPGGSFAEPPMAALVGGGFGRSEVGTSFAAPVVSGAAALLVEADPAATPDSVRARITATARKLSRVAVSAQGAGLVQLVAAAKVPAKKAGSKKAAAKKAAAKKAVAKRAGSKKAVAKRAVAKKAAARG